MNDLNQMEIICHFTKIPCQWFPVDWHSQFSLQGSIFRDLLSRLSMLSDKF